ncbi:sigma factor [Mesorhizobium sp. BR1-1-6]|uniref:sigma factor n=1 Tax=Mesorhizobium sp. BR1-1-6 TaxID=2876648 RepID=UPI00398CC378
MAGFAHTFYRAPNDADDLVQETLVKALNAFDSCEQGTRLKSWMFTITRNTFYTKVRVYAPEAPGATDWIADLSDYREKGVRAQTLTQEVRRPYQER